MPIVNREKLLSHVPPPDTAAEKGGGCLVAFSLPFITVGVGIFLLSIGFFGQSASNAKAPAWMLSGFGLIFAIAGMGLAAAGVLTILRFRGAKQRKEAHPLEPWYWDYPWDSKGISSGGIGPVLKTFGFFAFLAAFMTPFNWWAFISDERVLPVQIFVGLFDLIGLLILWSALYLLFQYLKYGKSRLHFARFPFRPGASLEAGLEAGGRLANAPAITFHLRFVEEEVVIRGSGKNRSRQVYHYCLFEERKELLAGQFDTKSDNGVPVQFRLPDGEYSNRLGESPRYYWQLEVKAETPGIDYAAQFVIPVYGPDATRPRPGTDYDAIDGDEDEDDDEDADLDDSDDDRKRQ